MWKWIAWVTGTLVAAAAVIAFLVLRPDRAAQVAAGVAAQVICSGVFVSGQPAEAIAGEQLAVHMGPGSKLVRYATDPQAKRVTARFELLASAQAR